MRNRGFILGVRALAAVLSMAASGLVLAGTCEEEAKWVESDSQEHFMILAGRMDVFYDRSGPAFVMLLKTGSEEYEVGAIGVYANEDELPAFGAVPAQTYEEFLSEPRVASDVMLRLRIKGPQYERALQVLRSWDRRAREATLLYPEIALDNILLVKQATDELNRCGEHIASYPLDWGLEDDISENNIASLVPFEYFKELKRLNSARHVPDADMPVALVAAVEAPPAGHQHAHHHSHTQE